MALVAGIHAIAAYVLLLHAPARHALQEATAFMVTLVREQPRVERKNFEPPRPKPVQLRPVTVESVPVPMIATTNAPADLTAMPPAPQPPSPAMLAMPQPLSALAPPRFDADYLDNPAPVYPPLSRRLGEQGKVMLRVLVDASGAASQLEVRTSSGSQRLDTAAIDAVRRWKFAPAKQGDKLVAGWVLVPINFSLRG